MIKWILALLLVISAHGFDRHKHDASSRNSILDVLRRDSQCPSYTTYASTPHGPYSSGPLKIPFQRPDISCRTFTSPIVEKAIEEMKSRLADPDLARLFENCFPNTLDTTIKWRSDSTNSPKTFIVTGDIDAQWIRDSYQQISVYNPLLSKDDNLRTLILGAINAQVEFLDHAPYCNAFNAPPESNIAPSYNRQQDFSLSTL